MKWKVLIIILAAILLLGSAVKVASDKIFNYILLSSLTDSDIKLDSLLSDKTSTSEITSANNNENSSTNNDNATGTEKIKINENREELSETSEIENIAQNGSHKNADSLAVSVNKNNITSSDENSLNDTNSSTAVDPSALSKTSNESNNNVIVSDNVVSSSESRNVENSNVENSNVETEIINDNIANENTINYNTNTFGQKILKLFKKKKNTQINDSAKNNSTVEDSQIIDKDIINDNGESKTASTSDNNTSPESSVSDENDENDDAADIIKVAEQKVSTTDKFKASQILLSKLKPSDISILKDMLIGGDVTDEELSRAKQIIKERVTEDEKEILKSMFNKYQSILDD